VVGAENQLKIVTQVDRHVSSIRELVRPAGSEFFHVCCGAQVGQSPPELSRRC
jgi:hypothetical protein